jgi:hypothetical protein
MSRLADLLRPAWGEHGAWAVGLTSCAAGVAMARSPAPAVLLLLPGVALFVGAKGFISRWRRTGKGLLPAAVVGLLGLLCVLPAALRAPLAFGAAAAIVLPFSLLYAYYAGSPRWTRSLGVEVGGSTLLAGSAAFPILAARPLAEMEALLAGLFFVLVFLPGVLRARIPKDPAPLLRSLAAGLALAAACLAASLPLLHLASWWILLAVPPLLKDGYRAWSLPAWTTRTLGLNLTLKGIYVAAVAAACWKPTAG